MCSLKWPYLYAQPPHYCLLLVWHVYYLLLVFCLYRHQFRFGKPEINGAQIHKHLFWLA